MNPEAVERVALSSTLHTRPRFSILRWYILGVFCAINFVNAVISNATYVVDVRMKLYWGVFNQSMKRVALYDYSQKKEADKKAADLGANGKSPHFVQKVKEVVEE